jgi:hypothetical protein
VGELSGTPGIRGLFTKVIGMLDGILISTRSSSRKEINNPDDCRSGLKKRIGINCQAMCDAKLRFIFISVKCPGKTHDLKAYEHSVLSQLVENLPFNAGGSNLRQQLLVNKIASKITSAHEKTDFETAQDTPLVLAK